MPPKITGIWKNLLLLFLTLVATLALVEATLRLADFPKQSIKLERIYDPILLYRIPGDFPGVNKDGFRNQGIPRQVDAVTLGDSHTYGYNAAMEDTWPSQLARMAGFSVYNMGIGGHGPLQYYHVFESALQLKPHFIVVGLYLANDIKGICDLYLKTDYWKTGAKREGLDLEYCNDAAPKNVGRRQGKFRKKTGLSDRLSETISDTKIATLVEMGTRLGRSHVPFDTKSFIVLDDGKNRLHMVNKEVRNNRDYMDLGRPEIAQSLAVTKELLARMSVRSKQTGAQLVILLIPSKGTVLHDYLDGKQRKLPAVYQESARNETLLGTDVMAWLAQQGIPYVDARSAVVSALAKEGNVYPLDGDDHPVATGYKAYAQALYDGYFAVRKP
jgi:lysophospholipase L1-like esterase